MTPRPSPLSAPVLCLALSLGLVGCGGGGTDPVSGLFYTGTQAAADLSKPEAATALLTEGYGAAATLYALGDFHRGLERPDLVDPADAPRELTGACANPGTATLSYRVDLAAGTVSGEVVWQGYCVAGRSLSGRATFTGSLLPDPTQPPYYGPLELDLGGGVGLRTAAAAYTLQGRLRVEPGAPVRLVGGSDLFQRREATGEVDWIKDLQVKESTDPDKAALWVEGGTVFDPRYGGADLRSVNLGFLVPRSGPCPVQGQLEATASGGIRAVLTASENETFEVAIYEGTKLRQTAGVENCHSLGL